MVRHTGKDFINVQGVAVATMPAFQSSSVNCSELDAPKPDRFSANSNASLGQQIFDVSETEVEALVQPDGVADDIGRESMAFIGSYLPNLPISAA